MVLKASKPLYPLKLNIDTWGLVIDNSLSALMFEILKATDTYGVHVINIRLPNHFLDLYIKNVFDFFLWDLMWHQQLRW